jgi:hypothetical protein
LKDFESGTPNQATVVIGGSVDNVVYQALDTLTYSTAADSLALIAGSADLRNYPHSASNDAPNNYPLSFKYLRVKVFPTNSGDSIWVRSIWLNVLPR